MRRLDRLSVSRALEAALVERLGAELRPAPRLQWRLGRSKCVISAVVAVAVLAAALLAFIHR